MNEELKNLGTFIDENAKITSITISIKLDDKFSDRFRQLRTLAAKLGFHVFESFVKAESDHCEITIY
jgi:hypothetical protein